PAEPPGARATPQNAQRASTPGRLQPGQAALISPSRRPTSTHDLDLDLDVRRLESICDCTGAGGMREVGASATAGADPTTPPARSARPRRQGPTPSARWRAPRGVRPGLRPP